MRMTILFALLVGCTGPRPTTSPPGDGSTDETETGKTETGDGEAAADPESIAPTTEHAFSAIDLMAMDRISEHQISPDGKTIVFVRRVTDLKEDRGRTDLWSIPVAGGEPKRLTKHPETDVNPRFSADGKTIFFVSTRSGSPQVWKMPVAGGDATQVTDFPLPVGNVELSPDGKLLAFSTEVFVDCDDLQCTADRVAEREKSKRHGQRYDAMFVRHWDTWKDGRRSHLFVAPVGGGTPRDLTPGLDADVPSKPFGGAEEFAFSPDGKTIIYTARVAGRSEPWSTDFDLYAVPVDGGDARELTADNPAWDTSPVFAPDGKTLVWLAMKRPGYEADRFRVMAMSWPDGKARVVTEAWDRSAGEPTFTPDGKALLVTAENVGQKSLFRVDLGNGQATEVVREGWIGEPAIAGDKIVFARNDLRQPTELFSVALAGGEPSQVTHLNDEKVKLAKMGQPEQFSFKGARGDTVYGYVVQPVDFDPAKKYPIAFLIHGGPQGSFGNMFHYRWNPQTYAGAGYAVVMIDFHGSTGYGQAFTDAIRDDWGGKPLGDLQKGLKHAVGKYKWLDGSKACALGASYGGFMVNWIAGKWRDGFKCLVNHDGLFDHRIMYYATEELWFPEWEHAGPYYENPKAHEKHNPVLHVGSWKTPMLVVHGALDFRVPLTQGLATFTALQRRGIESRLLVFPDENHWVLHPNNSLQWHEEVLSWLGQHLR